MTIAARLSLTFSSIWCAIVFAIIVFGGPWTTGFGWEVIFFFYLWGLPALSVWFVLSVIGLMFRTKKSYGRV